MSVPEEIILPMPGYDHSSICKFEGVHSVGYKIVLNVLREWVDELRKS
jgi:hypothetical protein